MIVEDNLYYIDIDKESIPYRFDITLGNSVYLMDVRYNRMADLFTIDLYTQDEDVITYGEPVIYGKPLFSDMADSRLPISELIALDVSGVETQVSWDNLGKTVFLYDFAETDTPPEEGDA